MTPAFKILDFEIPTRNSEHGLQLTYEFQHPLAALLWMLGRWQGSSIVGLVPAIEAKERFRTDSFGVRPAGEGDDPLRAKWKELSDLDAGGDAVVVRAEPVRDALLFPRQFLLDLMRRYEETRKSTPPFEPLPSAPSLFTEPFLGEAVHPHELEILRKVEDWAALMEGFAINEGLTSDAYAGNFGELLFLLLAVGVFDPHHNTQRYQYLHDHGFPLTAAYVRAAQTLMDYYASDERRREVTTPPPEKHILLGNVSVDLFRRAGPDTNTSFQWIAQWEHVFELQPIAPRAFRGQDGEVLGRAGGAWHRLIWRADRGKPALLQIIPM